MSSEFPCAIPLVLAPALVPRVGKPRPVAHVAPGSVAAAASLAAAAPHGGSGKDWRIAAHAIGADGGHSSTGVFELTGTMGQPDAGALVPDTSGPYTLRAGFWFAAAAPALRPDLVLTDGFKPYPTAITGSAQVPKDHQLMGPRRRWMSVPLVLLLSLPGDAFAETFACSRDSIRVFADDTFPTSAPIRILEGANTGIFECYGLALDRKHREIWIAHGDVSAFPMEAQGNVPPTRVVPIGSVGLGFAVSVAVDVEADEVVVGTADTRIHAFSRSAGGSAPLRTIVGSAVGVATVVGLAIDRERDRIYFASLGPPAFLGAFSRTVSGPAMLAEPAAPLEATGQIAVDAGAGEMYIVSGGSILVATGSTLVRPFSAGFLQAPFGLALRADGDVLVGDRIAMGTEDPVLRFAAEPAGAPPVATLLYGSAPGRTLWGVATSREAACSSGNVARCLFADGLEALPD